MSEGTARFGLPRIVAGQAQKDVTHNEALALIDALLHVAVETALLSVPPAAPAIGRCWIVAAGAGGTGGGAWAGHAGDIACWTDGGWRFAAPVRGMTAWVADRDLPARWTGSEWSIGTARASRLLCDGIQVVGAQRGAIPSPAGGQTIDPQARDAISAILAALRDHGLIAT